MKEILSCFKIKKSKNSILKIQFGITTESTYQSSINIICPSDWTFLEANRSNCKGVTKVIPLAEMARVRICRFKKKAKCYTLTGS